jgi:hypothetical protein
MRFGTDPDPDLDPAIFVSDVNKKFLLFEDTFTSFFKDKSHTEVTKQLLFWLDKIK